MLLNDQALTDAQIYHLHFSRHSPMFNSFRRSNGLSTSHLLSLTPTLVPSFQVLSYSCESTHEPDQTTHPSYKGTCAKKDSFNPGKFPYSSSRVPTTYTSQLKGQHKERAARAGNCINQHRLQTSFYTTEVKTRGMVINLSTCGKVQHTLPKYLGK